MSGRLLIRLGLKEDSEEKSVFLAKVDIKGRTEGGKTGISHEWFPQRIQHTSEESRSACTFADLLYLIACRSRSVDAASCVGTRGSFLIGLALEKFLHSVSFFAGSQTSV